MQSSNQQLTVTKRPAEMVVSKQLGVTLPPSLADPQIPRSLAWHLVAAIGQARDCQIPGSRLKTRTGGTKLLRLATIPQRRSRKPMQL